MEETKLYYQYGLPFSKYLASAFNQLNDRVLKLNKASFIIIDGAVGSGKTIAGVSVADYFNGAYILQADGSYIVDSSKFIGLNLQYAMGAKDFMKKIVLCYKAGLHVMVYDEAGDFSKRGSLTKLNQDLNRIFEICRAFQVVIIIVLPNFFYIDRSVLDKEMIRALIRISRDSEKYSYYKMWDMNGLNWIKWRSMKLPVPNQCYNYQKPIQEGCFLPLNEERMSMLRHLSNKDKISTAESISAKSDSHKSLSTIKHIATIYNVSLSTVREFIRNHKVKSKGIEGKTNLYDGKDIERIVKKWGMNNLPPKEAEP